MRAFRLSSPAFDPLSGEGAARYGGRWNSPGGRLAYSSENLSLAVLETLVHVDDLAQMPLDRHYFEFDIDDSEVEPVPVDELPEDWTNRRDVTRRIGDEWLHAQRSAALHVPSAVIVLETNILINPEHPAFPDSIEELRSGPLSLDSRLRT